MPLVALPAPALLTAVLLSGPARAGIPFIVNGVPEPDHPAVLSLGTDALGDPISLCTASLITPRVVLTAAHCTEFIPEELIVAAGRAFFGADINAPDHTLNFSAVHLHPDYVELQDGGAVMPEFDISVMVLSEDAPVAPIWWRTRPLGEDDLGTELLSVGFGLDERGRSGTKRSAPLRLDSYDEQFVISHNRTNPEGANICSGDSGGPQFAWSETHQAWEQIAVHSWGDQDCRTTSGSTRTDIAADWIRARIAEVHGTDDRCAILGYHGDGVCDDFCLELEGTEDPDCLPPEDTAAPLAEDDDGAAAPAKEGCATVAAAPGLWLIWASLPLLLVRREV